MVALRYCQHNDQCYKATYAKISIEQIENYENYQQSNQLHFSFHNIAEY